MKLKKITLIASTTLLITACSRVPPGNVGVLVNNWGDDKGVQTQVVGVGYYNTFFGKTLYLFPTFMQTYTYTDEQAISFQSAEGLTLTTDVGVTYQIDPDKAATVFQEYRTGLDEITQTFLHNYIRDAMNQVGSGMKADQLMGSGKDQFINQVNQIVINEAAQKGITIDKVSLVGTFNAPDSLKEAVSRNTQAQQDTQTAQQQVQIATAQAQSLIIKAQAEAKANQLIAASLSPELVQYKAMDKWDGKLPQITGGGAMPFVKLTQNENNAK